MKKVIYLMSFAFLISIAACKEDKCDSVLCSNGGTCENGKCQCVTGWTGATCDTSTDVCHNVVCYHGGVCLTGTCICPGHTSGADCSVLETPTRIYIMGITVNHFHPTDRSGTQWDADMGGGNADIYPVIKRNGVVIFHGYNDNINYCYKENANYDTQYKLYLHEDSIAIDDVTNPNYRLELWDHDGGGNPDDSMYGFNFTPFTGLDGFPSSFSYHDTTYYNDEFEFRINFFENNNTYVW